MLLTTSAADREQRESNTGRENILSFIIDQVPLGCVRQYSPNCRESDTQVPGRSKRIALSLTHNETTKTVGIYQNCRQTVLLLTAVGNM